MQELKGPTTPAREENRQTKTPSPGEVGKPDIPQPEIPAERKVGIFIPAPEAGVKLYVVILPLSLILLAAIIIYLRRADVIVKDSGDFLDALQIWHPIVIARQNTPRSLKRYLNRVRYFAMGLRAKIKEFTGWQRFISELRNGSNNPYSTEENKDDGMQLSESMLV